MTATCLTRRPVVVGGAALLIALSSLATACGNGGNEAPSGTTTPTTTTSPSPSPSPSPTPSPTEKSISPTGGNMFTPTVMAPPPPTMAPGNHHHRGLGGY